MKVTKIVVTYFDGTIETHTDWEHIDLRNAANIATIEETTLMSLSEVKSRYRFITPSASSSSIDEDFTWKKWNDSKHGHEPKGSLGT